MPYTGVTAKLTVKEGATDTKVAYISNWSIEENRNIIENTNLGDKAKGKLPSVRSWSASADGAVDYSTGSSHLTLRNSMKSDTPISVTFFLDDSTKLEGQAFIESLSVDVSAEDKANISISLSGLGDLTLATS